MPHTKKVEVDEHRLDELKCLLDIDADAEAVNIAIVRIIELEETLLWLAELGREPHICEDEDSEPSGRLRH